MAIPGTLGEAFRAAAAVLDEVRGPLAEPSSGGRNCGRWLPLVAAGCCYLYLLLLLLLLVAVVVDDVFVVVDDDYYYFVCQCCRAGTRTIGLNNCSEHRRGLADVVVTIGDDYSTTMHRATNIMMIV